MRCCDFNKIANNMLDRNYVEGHGIFLKGSDYNEIQNNKVWTSKYDGIRLEYSKYNNISDNTLQSNYDNGMVLYDSSSNNIIKNNIAESNMDNGFYLYHYSEYNTIANNTAKENKKSGFLIDVHEGYSSCDNKFQDNKALKNDGNGFNVSSSRNTLTKNTAKENKENGFLLENADQNTLTNNTADSNDYYGIYLRSSSNNNIEKNVIVRCTINDNSWSLYMETDAENNEFKENTVGSNYPTTITIYDYHKGFKIRGAEDPPESPKPPEYPTTHDSISKYVEMQNLSADTTLSLDFHYKDTDVEHINEDSLKVWKHNGTAWDEGKGDDAWNGTRKLDTANNIVGVEVKEFCIFAPLAGAPVHNIDTEEGFNTIQEAIDDADTKDGHTITVDLDYTEAGTKENLLVNKKLTIKSSSGNPYDTVIEAENDCEAAIKIVAEKATIQGFTVKGATRGDGTAGIYILSSTTDYTISHSIITDNNLGILCDIEDAHALVLENVKVRNNGNDGVRLLGGDLVIKGTDNEIINNDGNGTSVLKGDVTIEGNTTIHDNGGWGIFAIGGKVVIKKNAMNNINRNGKGGILGGNGVSLPPNFVVEDNGGPGIVVASADDGYTLTLESVKVRKNGGDGIGILLPRIVTEKSKVNLRLKGTGNEIINNGGNGTSVLKGDVTIEGNTTIHDNGGWGIFAPGGKVVIKKDAMSSINKNGKGGIFGWAGVSLPPNFVVEDNGGPGIVCGGENPLWLENIKVSNNKGDGIGTLFGSVDVVIKGTGNEIVNNGGNGTSVLKGDVTIEGTGTEIHDNGGWGIFAAGGKVEIKKDAMSSINKNGKGGILGLKGVKLPPNFVVEDNGGPGIVCGGKDTLTLENVKVRNNGHDGIGTIGEGNVIIKGSSTEITNNAGWGIQSREGKAEIRKATVTNNAEGGIRLFSSEHGTIAGNTVSNNGEYGIFLSISNDNTIYNNIFNNPKNAVDDGTNTWNIVKTEGTNIVGGPYLGGNYWSDYAGEDLDEPPDGLGDTLLPYTSSGGITNGGDHHPLIRPYTPPGTPVETATGSGTAYVATDAGTIEDIVAIDEATLPAGGKPDLVFPHGFFSFNITGLTPGQTVVVTITLPDNVPVGTEYWKYHASEGGWIRIPMGSDDGDDVITITLVDGGLGDDDGTADGVIVDQGGPGIPGAPPVITFFAPPSPVNDTVCNWRTFDVTVNQTVNVSWYLNNTLRHTNVSTKEANYTLHAEVAGEHNVSAVATNANGTDMQTWIWNVTAAPLPVLEINKTDVPDPVPAGGTLNYTLSVNNTGNATATNVTVMETYDENVTFVAAVPAPSSGDDTWQFPTLNVSETRWIYISVTVNASVLNGTVLHNYVNVTCDEGVTDSDTENTTVFVAPALPPNITSFAPPSPVNDTVCNWRTFNVTVDQTVNVSWYLNNTPQHTNVSIREASYTLHAEVVGEHNVSAIASNENGTDMQTWVWNVTAAPLPVLEINKTDNPDPVSPGGTLNYTIAVNNTGNATATNVTVMETYDKNVTFVVAVPAPSSGDDSWQFPTLNASETRWMNISVTVNASVPNGTVLHNIVNVTCAEGVTDTDTENTTAFAVPVCVETATGTGIACFAIDSGTIEDLVAVDESTLPEEGKPKLVFPHGFFSFNVTGLTQGQTVVVTITLPDNVPVGTEYWKYHAAEGGWIRIPMGSDDGDNILTITLVDGGLGDDDGIANGVIVDQGGPGVRAVKPELTKSAPTSVAPGGTITYTILYANVGLVALTDVTITENYPEGVTFISADPAPDAGTNNKWTIGTLPAGASGQIIIKVKVPDSPDLTFTETGSVTGEGFVMVNKDLSTEQKPYRLKNVVTISCAETDPVTASASTTVSGVPGTSLEITEHGSGIYESEELLNFGTKNKSIRLQKSTEAEYQPTSFYFSDSFSVDFTNKWMQDICSKNMVMGDAMHKKIKDATYIKDETKTETGEYGTSMEFASSFQGAAHIGAVSKDVTTSEDYIGEFEIFWAAKEECQYLFNWSRVPGNDSENLIRFLVDVLAIKLYWAENATITKSNGDRIINVSTDWRSAEVILAANNETATVKVGNETIYVLDVRTEDGSLNVYDCRLRKISESVAGEGYVMVDKELTSSHIQVVEHGSGIYSSDTDFDSQRLKKSTEAEYQPTTFNFSDGFGVNFSSNWMQSICSKDKKAGTAIHKKISDAASIADDTTATKSSMAFETSFNGSIHIGARTEEAAISEDYIGRFNVSQVIKIGDA